MKAKLLNNSLVYGIKKGYVFDVESQDDGFYSRCPFYAGWIRNENGVKQWATFDKDLCEIIEY